MSNFSAEERERIIAESYANLQRGTAELLEIAAYQPPAEDVLATVISAPVEDPLTKWRREQEEAEQRRAATRAREKHAREARAVRRWLQTESQLENQLTVVEQLLFDITHATSKVGESIEHELRDLREENVELRIALAKLETLFAELSLQLTESIATDRGKTIDLPNPLRARMN